jgi:hypothetical protein
MLSGTKIVIDQQVHHLETALHDAASLPRVTEDFEVDIFMAPLALTRRHRRRKGLNRNGALIHLACALKADGIVKGHNMRQITLCRSSHCFVSLMSQGGVETNMQ